MELAGLSPAVLIDPGQEEALYAQGVPIEAVYVEEPLEQHEDAEHPINQASGLHQLQ